MTVYSDLQEQDLINLPNFFMGRMSKKMERCSKRMVSNDIYTMEALITAVVHTRIIGYMGSKLEAIVTQELHSPR